MKELSLVSESQQVRIRNLHDVFRLMDGIRETVKEDDLTLERYQRLFAHAVTALARSRVVAKEVILDDEDENKVSLRTKTPSTPEKKWIPVAPHALKLPRLPELKQNYNVLNNYTTKLQMLTKLEAELLYNFLGEKNHNKALSELRSLKASIQKKLEVAYKFITTVTEKVVPKEFKNLSDAVFKQVQVKLKGRFETSDIKLLVKPSSKPGEDIIFARYLNLGQFIDDGGYIYKSYYIVFTLTVKSSGVGVINLTTTPAFAMPGSYPVGVEVDDVNGALHALTDILEVENVMDVLHDTNNPIDKDAAQIFKQLPFVKEVDVRNDLLVIKLKPNAKKKSDEAVGQIRGFLSTMFSASKSARLRSKYDSSKNEVLIQIIPQGGKSVIDRGLLRHLQDNLGLDKEEIMKIQKALYK